MSEQAIDGLRSSKPATSAAMLQRGGADRRPRSFQHSTRRITPVDPPPQPWAVSASTTLGRLLNRLHADRICVSAASLWCFAHRRRRFTLRLHLPADRRCFSPLGHRHIRFHLPVRLFGRVVRLGVPEAIHGFVYRPLERLCRAPPAGQEEPLKRRWVCSSCTALLARLVFPHVLGVLRRRRSCVSGAFTGRASRAVRRHGPVAAMMFDFAFFREQTCLVACPTDASERDARPQLADRGGDTERGEPDRRSTKHGTADLSLPVLGDCVSAACHPTCPTQHRHPPRPQMECVHCHWSTRATASCRIPARRADQICVASRTRR